MFDKAKDKAEEAAGAVQQQFGRATGSAEHEAKGTVRRRASQATYAVDDALDCARDAAAKSPLTALAVAAGVGFVLGKLLSSR